MGTHLWPKSKDPSIESEAQSQPLQAPVPASSGRSDIFVEPQTVKHQPRRGGISLRTLQKMSPYCQRRGLIGRKAPFSFAAAKSRTNVQLVFDLER